MRRGGYNFARLRRQTVSYVSELSEERFDLLVADLCRQAADENFAVPGLGLLRVDLLVVDDVLGNGGHLVDRLGRTVHNERESSRASG